MTIERHRLVRGLKIWVDFLFFVTVATGILSAIVWPLAGVTDSVGFDFNVPVVIGDRSLLPVLPLEVSREALESTVGGTSPFSLVNAKGELRFQASWLGPGAVFWILLVVTFGSGILGLHLLRRILATTAEGNPFHHANVRRLTLLGWLLVAVGMVGPLVEYFYSRSVLRRLEPLTGTPLSAPLRFQQEWIICGLLLLVLAAVWKQAVQMAEDQSLTV